LATGEEVLESERVEVPKYLSFKREEVPKKKEKRVGDWTKASSKSFIDHSNNQVGPASYHRENTVNLNKKAVK